MPESFHDDIDATARHWFIRQQGRALSAEEQRALTTGLQPVRITVQPGHVQKRTGNRWIVFVRICPAN